VAYIYFSALSVVTKALGVSEFGDGIILLSEKVWYTSGMQSIVV
jgi:hypothetical protein